MFLLNQAFSLPDTAKARPQCLKQELFDSLTKIAPTIGLNPTETLVTSANNLYEATLISTGVMLVGPVASGKSSVRRLLKSVLLEKCSMLGYAEIRPKVGSDPVWCLFFPWMFSAHCCYILICHMKLIIRLVVSIVNLD